MLSGLLIGSILISGTVSAQVVQDPPGPGRQDSPPAQPGETPSVLVEDVIVEGRASDQTDRIDRRVYDVTRDPLAQTSTALEVLGRLPSVSVSSSGGVSLLGQGNASVLIDGKPVANAGALRALLGSDLERIEVITNPSAEFRAQGTGGVVNIITRHRRPIGVSGNALAIVDTVDNARLSLSSSATAGRWTLSGNLTAEGTASEQRRDRFREPIPFAALPDFVEASEITQSGRNYSLGANATYSFDENRSLSFGGTASNARSDTDTELVVSTDEGGGETYTDVGDSKGAVDTADAQVEFSLRTAGGRGLVKLTGTASSNDLFTTDEFARFESGSAAAELFSTASRYATDRASVGSSIEYDLPNDTVVKGGLGFDREAQVVERLFSSNHSPASITGLRGRTDILSVYGSVQWPIFGWTAMSGLRVEQDFREVEGAGPGVDGEDAQLFPSFFLRKALSPEWTLNLSYSRRINRPDLGRLDPRVVLTTPSDAYMGNPELEPEFTNAFELRLEHVSGENNASATVYHRITSDVFQPSFSQFNDEIIIQKFINEGTQTNTGVDVNFRRVFSEYVRLSGSATIYRSERDVVAGPTISIADFTTFAGGLSLTYKPLGSDRSSDTWQWSVRYSGESRGFQSETSDFFQSSLTWRHPLSERWVSVVNVSDLFDTGDQTFVLSGPGFRQTTESRGRGPQVKWTLSYRFGALN